MTPADWHETPISAEHDRKRFDCGEPELNIYLQRYPTGHDAGHNRFLNIPRLASRQQSQAALRVGCAAAK